MSKKNDKNNQPPSLFDNLDLFAAAPTTPASPAPAEPKKSPEPAAPKKKAAAAAEPPPPPPPAPPAPPASGSLTGHGPLRELYDYNFREYSAYVI